jgi:2-hydroxychromene-2-carboxylate isomerase
MPPPIDFYFDFSSPYAYLASEQIEAIATRFKRSVAYKPMLLGVVFKAIGTQPLVEYPKKGEYSRHDFERSARFAKVPFKMPEKFPVSTVNAARALLWLQASGSAKAVSFVHRTFRAYFAEGRDISDAAVLADIAEDLGVDKSAMQAATQDPAIKDKLKQACEEALARGVFGAPFIFVDGEPFWGNDRLAQIALWLERGPF